MGLRAVKSSPPTTTWLVPGPGLERLDWQQQLLEVQQEDGVGHGPGMLHPPQTHHGAVHRAGSGDINNPRNFENVSSCTGAVLAGAMNYPSLPTPSTPPRPRQTGAR